MAGRSRSNEEEDPLGPHPNGNGMKPTYRYRRLVLAIPVKRDAGRMCEKEA
jgi:hypothetical protein